MLPTEADIARSTAIGSASFAIWTLLAGARTLHEAGARATRTFAWVASFGIPSCVYLAYDDLASASFLAIPYKDPNAYCGPVCAAIAGPLANIAIALQMATILLVCALFVAHLVGSKWASARDVPDEVRPVAALVVLLSATLAVLGLWLTRTMPDPERYWPSLEVSETRLGPGDYRWNGAPPSARTSTHDGCTIDGFTAHEPRPCDGISVRLDREARFEFAFALSEGREWFALALQNNRQFEGSWFELAEGRALAVPRAYSIASLLGVSVVGAWLLLRAVARRRADATVWFLILVATLIASGPLFVAAVGPMRLLR